MDNRIGEMDVFVQVAELQSFSAAGRKLKLSPSAVSKLVTGSRTVSAHVFWCARPAPCN